MTPSLRSAPRRNRTVPGAAGRVSKELPQPPSKAEPKWREEGFEGKYEVVYSRVAFRSAASTKATLLHVAKLGTVLSGTVEVAEGSAWLKLSEPWHSEVTGNTSAAWVLIHGACVGLGDLLRPAHEKSESVEALLRRLAGDHSERVEPVIQAVKDAGFLTGSQLLAGTETPEDREKFMTLITEHSSDAGIEVPNQIVSCLRAFVEDSRLAFSGYPYSPPYTKNRILFTAPHSLPLVRPGHRPHLPEKLTSHLAREFANIVGGAYLTWTQKEDYRALEHFRCEGSPDITNRDPNFTPRHALSESPWTRNLGEVKALWGPHRPCLHVDLHGCKDPAVDNGSHLVIGARAMEFAGRSNFAEALRVSLQRSLAVALRGLSVNVRPQKQLTGALEDNCCTLTQQSMSLEGGVWAGSVQLEMSRSLRKRLATDKELRSLTAQAIWIAWILSTRDVVDPHAFTHALGYWVARCKAFYAKKPLLELSEAATKAEPVEPTSPKTVSEDASPGCEVEKTKAEEEDDEVIDVEGEEEDEEANEVNAAVEENAAAETAGGATANSEPRGVPLEGNLDELAENMLKFSKMLEGVEVPAKSPMSSLIESRPSRVQLFRDWLKSPYEYDTVTKLAGEAPMCRFSVAGSWNSFEPSEMTWNGSRFVSDVKIGPAGREQFQIWIEGDGKRALYPNVNSAGPFIRHTLKGPDGNGHGKNWLIGRPSTEAVPGDHFRIGLTLDADESAVEVAWELIKRAPRVDKEEEARKRREEEEARRRHQEEEEAEICRRRNDVRKRQEAEAEERRKVEESRRAWEEEEAVRQADALREQLDAIDALREKEEAEAFLDLLFAEERPKEERRTNAQLPLQAEEKRPAAKSPPRKVDQPTGRKVDVVIYIDRELGLCMPAQVKLGTTVQSLKHQLAESDLTGGTSPDAIQLSLSGAAEPLDNAELITADHAELDIWVPGS
mmetsp:Transcript_103626/g.195174  ORF Transcript_103626/g.195174 Transcript_103626/m.195174 type:complete len:951 (-) Transcript_103626:31-2883(-)